MGQVLLRWSADDPLADRAWPLAAELAAASRVGIQIVGAGRGAVPRALRSRLVNLVDLVDTGVVVAMWPNVRTLHRLNQFTEAVIIAAEWPTRPLSAWARMYGARDPAHLGHEAARPVDTGGMLERIVRAAKRGGREEARHAALLLEIVPATERQLVDAYLVEQFGRRDRRYLRRPQADHLSPELWSR